MALRMHLCRQASHNTPFSWSRDGKSIVYRETTDQYDPATGDFNIPSATSQWYVAQLDGTGAILVPQGATWTVWGQGSKPGGRAGAKLAIDAIAHIVLAWGAGASRLQALLTERSVSVCNSAPATS